MSHRLEEATSCPHRRRAAAGGLYGACPAKVDNPGAATMWDLAIESRVAA